MSKVVSSNPAASRQARVLPILLVVLVGAASVWSSPHERAGWAGAIGAAFFAVWAARRSGPAALAYQSLALVVAALAGSEVNPSLQATAAIGVWAGASAACVGLARLPAEGGTAPVRRVSARVSLAVLALACVTALGPSLYPGVRVTDWLIQHSSAKDVFTLVATIGALYGLTARMRRVRRLDLGALERAEAARTLQLLVIFGAAFVAVIVPDHARTIARLGVAAASAGVAAVASAPDAVGPVRVVRRSLALALTGGGLAILATLAAEGPTTVWIVTLTAAVALAIGSAAPFAERPLKPEGGEWLDAFARAREEAIRADPDDAIRCALIALRQPYGPAEPSPELWTLSPAMVTTVDAASYCREQAAELPAGLLAVIAAEPEVALRGNVLEALEVRRPDLRPLATWMASRDAIVAMRVGSEDEPEGVLILPKGHRRERFTLEELRALRIVCGVLAGACRTRESLARLRSIAQQSDALAQAAQARAAIHVAEQGLAALRSLRAERRLCRPAEEGIYSATARMALEALERRMEAGRPILVLSPSGLDPVAFVLRAHLETIRAVVPLVVVDGSDPRERPFDQWQDAETSPLALADGGILTITDAAALSAETQALIGRACVEGRAPWEQTRPLNVQLVLTAVYGSDCQRVFDPLLLDALGSEAEDPVTLPRLSDRPEDFRSLLLEGLARESLRTLGTAVGIESAAYAKLADHDFPGDVAELSVIIQRLVAGCRGNMIRLTDVEALGIGGSQVRSGHTRDRLRKDPMSA